MIPIYVSLPIFAFEISHFPGVSKVVQKGRNWKFYKKNSYFYQILAEKASQPDNKPLLVSNNGFLFEIVTFYL